jgi:hypothetical protein
LFDGLQKAARLGEVDSTMTRGLDALLITAALAGIQDCPTEPNSAEAAALTDAGVRFASGRSRHQCGVTP